VDNRLLPVHREQVRKHDSPIECEAIPFDPQEAQGDTRVSTLGTVMVMLFGVLLALLLVVGTAAVALIATVLRKTPRLIAAATLGAIGHHLYKRHKKGTPQ